MTTCDGGQRLARTPRALEAAGVEFIDESGGGPRRPPTAPPPEEALKPADEG
jgi:hypothetical protein